MLSDEEIIDLHDKISIITGRSGEGFYIVSYLFDKHPALKSGTHHSHLLKKGQVLQTLFPHQSLQELLTFDEAAKSFTYGALHDFWLPFLSPAQRVEIDALLKDKATK